MEPWISVVIAGISLIVTVTSIVIGGTWALRNNTEAIVRRVDDKIDGLEAKLNQDVDQLTKRYGESLSAIRTKITDTELWNRDNFVSKATFRTVVDDFKVLYVELGKRLDTRFDKLDAKLDRLSEH